MPQEKGAHMEPSGISSDFNFDSRHITIRGSRIHYIETGTGDPILFLHGNPTSSYVWRNIIPHVANSGRCVAMDLIGMGRSDKPPLEYRFVDHARYVDGFIEQLGLKNITLVLHDWGSALGLYYAMRNEKNIKAMAFMEAILRTSSWADFPRAFRMGFKLFRTPLIGWFLIAGLNVFVAKILPQATVRKLTEAEMERYREPFRKIRHRKPVWRWPNEIPIDGTPADVTTIVQSYSRWLQGTDLPKLLFFAHPGAILSAPLVEWCRQNLRNLTTRDVGKGLHFLQEDNPRLIGTELAKWYTGL
jgi:haloalkane dehalogenase